MRPWTQLGVFSPRPHSARQSSYQTTQQYLVVNYWLAVIETLNNSGFQKVVKNVHLKITNCYPGGNCWARFRSASNIPPQPARGLFPARLPTPPPGPCRQPGTQWPLPPLQGSGDVRAALLQWDREPSVSGLPRLKLNPHGSSPKHASPATPKRVR